MCCVVPGMEICVLQDVETTAGKRENERNGIHQTISRGQSKPMDMMDIDVVCKRHPWSASAAPRRTTEITNDKKDLDSFLNTFPSEKDSCQIRYICQSIFFLRF